MPGSEAYESLLKQHRTLGELLLQLLLWLDGVQCPAAWEEARKERKQGVKSVQVRPRRGALDHREPEPVQVSEPARLFLAP